MIQRAAGPGRPAGFDGFAGWLAHPMIQRADEGGREGGAEGFAGPFAHPVIAGALKEDVPSSGRRRAADPARTG